VPLKHAYNREYTICRSKPGAYPGYFFNGEKNMSVEFYALVKKLREYRLDHGITLQQIEEATGISVQRLKRIEQGISPVTVEEVETLLSFYHTDANTILSYQDLQHPVSWQQKVLKTGIWIALLGVLVYGGYQGYKIVRGTDLVETAKEKTSVSELMKQEQSSGQGEKMVSDWLTSSPASSVSSSKEKEEKNTATSPHFHLTIYGEKPYHTGSDTTLTTADFQLFPISEFKAGQGVPNWLKEAAKQSKVAVDIANADILRGQTRESVAKEAGLLAEHQIKVMGYGKASDVFHPHIMEKNGTRYGFLVYSRVVPAVEWKAEGNRIGVADAYGEHIFDDIRRAKQKVDVLIVSMYWGKEGQTVPERYQKEMALDLLNAGADMIVGHRGSISQPYEVHNGKYIFYNIGKAQLDVQFDRKKIKEIALIDGGKRKVLSPEK
jgi:transcriptional regulator with XRE-family HTH domain